VSRIVERRYFSICCVSLVGAIGAQTDRQMDPILRPNPSRFVLFPIKYLELWKLVKQAQACYWVADEIDIASDWIHWETHLNDGERHFISYVLAFFAASDGIVGENLVSSFSVEVQVQEARCFYTMQSAIESIHGEVYSILIDTYIKDVGEKERLLSAISRIPCIEKKAAWAMKWMDKEANSFARRLVAFAAVEGIFFSGSFCSIFWLKKRGLMPGLCFSNELISRDEGLHCQFACALYKELQMGIGAKEFVEVIGEAVEIEKEFVCDALSCDLIGINSRTMSTYIEFVADHLLQAFGQPKLYGAQNPFEWMEMISLQRKTNFFEAKVSEYKKSGMEQREAFTLDADF
jgi:ribonucleotide reductase beta subunit family protein with ferritin-like domain